MKMQSSQPQNLVRKVEVRREDRAGLRHTLSKQWLVTNGLGGYASGTISGAVTWRYHGLLIAALPAPFGRTLMLNHLGEYLRFKDGRVRQFGGAESSEPEEEAVSYLTEFRLENQLPYWRYDIEGMIIEKRLSMLYLQNTVHLTYSLISGGEAQLELRPSVHFRPFEGNVGQELSSEYEVRARGRKYEVHSGQEYPALRLYVHGQESKFTNDGGSTRDIFYERDAERGYESSGALWSPGFFAIPLQEGGGGNIDRLDGRLADDRGA